MTDRCPECDRAGFDDCERLTCKWDRWNDGTRVTARQRADGAAFASKINDYLYEQRRKEAEAWREACRWVSEQRDARG